MPVYGRGGGGSGGGGRRLLIYGYNNINPSSFFARPSFCPSLFSMSFSINRNLSMYICVYLATGCSGKNVFFFHNSLQPPFAHIAVSDQSLLLAGIFCTTNSSRVLVKERWQTFENSLKKTQCLIFTLYNPSTHHS